jgi:predicted LPLAT superfamily acyltransferase
MKKVTYKKEFKSINEALTKVPNQLKEDNNIFEMTDGNKTIKVRWEGTLEEGKAVALVEKDVTLINEDMSHMKHLMGYASEKTIGTHKADGRVMENNKFKELLSVSKKKS